MTVSELNIKNRTYYFLNDLINILNFESINLKLDKKIWKDIIIWDIIYIGYYIGYIDKNKPKDWQVRTVNPLYLMINKVFCSVEDENCVRYLKIEKNHSEPALNKWNLVFDSIKDNIKKISNEEVNFNDAFNKIKFISDDSLRQDKLIYSPSLTVVIRCIFEKDNIFYPQVYLDDALYQL